MKKIVAKLGKKMLGMLVIFTLLATFVIIVPQTGADTPWWDNSYTYRRSIGITHTFLKYQTQITVVKANQSGGTISCNNHCQNDFDDIRFIGGSSDVLPYWRQNYTSGIRATFWVNNSYNDTTIYVYYGNPSAPYAGNGTLCFDFFDDFLGTTLNATKWATTGTPTISFSSGIMSFETNAASEYISSSAYRNFGKGTQIWTLCNFNFVAKQSEGIGYRVEAGAPYYTPQTLCLYSSSATTSRFFWCDGSAYTGGLTFTNPAKNRIIKLQRGVSRVWGWINSTIDSNSSLTIPTDTCDIRVGREYGADNSGVFMNWIFVAKFRDYTQHPPVWSSIGSQEIQGSSSSLPINSNPSPANGETAVELNPTMSITATSPGGHLLNVYMLSNVSGPWTVFASFLNVGNGTYVNYSTIFPSYLTKYWWAVHTKNTLNEWTNDTYYFTTKTNNTAYVYTRQQANTAMNNSAIRYIFLCADITTTSNFIISPTQSNKVFNGQNHTITGTNELHYGFYITGKTNITIRYCDISHFQYGIYFSTNTYCVVENNSIHNNTWNNGLSGIYLNNCDYCLIQFNLVHSHFFDGIRVQGGGSYNTIKNNLVHNVRREGIIVVGETHDTVKDNTIFNADWGICVGEGGAPSNNILVKNNIIFLKEHSNEGIEVYKNDYDITILNNNVYNVSRGHVSDPYSISWGASNTLYPLNGTTLNYYTGSEVLDVFLANNNYSGTDYAIYDLMPYGPGKVYGTGNTGNNTRDYNDNGTTGLSHLNMYEVTLENNPYPGELINTEQPRITINVPEIATINWYTNETGSWILHQKNTTTNIFQDVSYVYTGATSDFTTYYYKVIIDDMFYKETDIFNFTLNGLLNNAPSFGNPQPANESIEVTRYHATNVTVYDLDGNSTSVCFWSSISDNPYSWTKVQQNNSVAANTTVRDINSTYSNGWNADYWWKVTAYDGHVNSSVIYRFTTSFRWLNRAPGFGNPSPTNNSTGVVLYHLTNITVYDLDGNLTTVCFWNNKTGVWLKYQQNDSVTANSTIYCLDNSWAEDYSTEYWWMVSANDTMVNSTAVYHFTTEDEGIVIPPVSDDYTLMLAGIAALFILIALLFYIVKKR